MADPTALAHDEAQRTVTVTLPAWQWDRTCKVLDAMADDIEENARDLSAEVKAPLHTHARELREIARAIGGIVDNT